jgi:hypothetical protein
VGTREQVAAAGVRGESGAAGKKGGGQEANQFGAVAEEGETQGEENHQEKGDRQQQTKDGCQKVLHEPEAEAA